MRIEKTRACTAQTRTSRNKNGIGSKKADSVIIVAINTSPAKIFPNKRNDSETIFAISLTISIKH
ncbi:MAG: hypothetical protein U9M90_01275, partial [Patescibacteria group bacterium]|nr:hypothetical protein [Patescibacteria group bacterium]